MLSEKRDEVAEEDCGVEDCESGAVEAANASQRDHDEEAIVEDQADHGLQVSAVTVDIRPARVEEAHAGWENAATVSDVQVIVGLASDVAARDVEVSDEEANVVDLESRAVEQLELDLACVQLASTQP